MGSDHRWDSGDAEVLRLLVRKGLTDNDIARALGKTYDQVRYQRRKIFKSREIVKQSPLPRYDKPLCMEGDALVIPDLEIPFHHAEFTNLVLCLAEEWGIRKCIIAGDFLHFDSLSNWGTNWIQKSSVSENEENELIKFASKVPAKYRESYIQMVVNLTDNIDGETPSISMELSVARDVVKRFGDLFDEVHFVIGNHEGRLLRALDTPVFPEELLELIKADKRWKIAPYYYSTLISGGEKFQIEHPANAAKMTAIKLAAKFQCHVLVAHSHQWAKETDPSGRFWAIRMGHMVDELRMPYASQRHNTAECHKLGAVIVKDGYPHLLSIESPWFQKESSDVNSNGNAKNSSRATAQ